MTRITSRQVATLKRNFQSVFPLIVKREKLQAKIAELSAELDDTNAIIEATETGSRIITGGINSTELIQRRIVDSGKVDEKGQPMKTTKWEPIADRLILNEDGTYTIAVPVTPEASEPQSEAEGPQFEEPHNEQEEA